MTEGEMNITIPTLLLVLMILQTRNTHGVHGDVNIYSVFLMMWFIYTKTERGGERKKKEMKNHVPLLSCCVCVLFTSVKFFTDTDIKTCVTLVWCLRLDQGLSANTFWLRCTGYKIANVPRQAFMLPSLTDLPPMGTLMRRRCICCRSGKNYFCASCKIAMIPASPAHQLCTGRKI